MKFKLAAPTLDHKRQAQEFIDEFRAAGSEMHGFADLQNNRDCYALWIKQLSKDRMQAPNEGRVPAETYFLIGCEDDGTERIIGIVNIRLCLNANLWEFGGHIGYSIRPSERQKGYNKINLYLAICVCKLHRIPAVVLDCKKDNLGSAKTIQALGGVLLREFKRIEDLGKKPVIYQTYVINVNICYNRFLTKYADMIDEFPKSKK